MQNQETASYEVPAVPEAVRDARDWVAKTVTDWGFGAIADDLTLCLSEALTNSITHADHGDTVTVRAWSEEAMVHVEVVDCDRRLPQPKVPAEVDLHDPPPSGHRLEECGRGMYLINALSSRWGFEAQPPGKCVWFERDTEPELLIGVGG
jgi:anti-sigma regulatory factor (Ser/Thr protein kinase)